MTTKATIEQIRIIRAYAILMRNTALAKLCAEAEFDDLTPEVTAARRKLGEMIERARTANSQAKVAKPAKRVLTHLGMGHKVVEMGAKTTDGMYYYCTVCKRPLAVGNVSELKPSEIG